jgi:uncharacterized protein (TIGR02246 family)
LPATYPQKENTMSHAPRPRLHAWPVLALLTAVAIAGCDDSPTVAAPRHDALVVPDALAARMGTVPPAMERGIQELLQAWEAAWASMDGNAYGANYAEDAEFINPLGGVLSGRQVIAATHVFLFNGPFAGSVQTNQVRRIAPLTGTLAIVDVDGLLTGVVAFPPGLDETAPGEVATRGRLVVGKTGSRWEILAQQMTRIAPPPF